MRAVLLAVLLAGCAAPADEAGFRVLVALGDSITRAANAAGPGERPASSWATGHDAEDGVWSLAERLVNGSPRLSGNVHNHAQSGATMADLPRQAALAVDARADVVLVLLGANDACGGTPVDAFRARFRAGAEALRDGLPDDAVVYVVSFPNVTALWDAGKDSAEVRERWRALGACPDALGGSATNESRAAVAARVEALNRVLMEEAAAFGFATDGLAVARSPVEPAHLSRVDAFHPSLVGQARLAEVAWGAGPFA